MESNSCAATMCATVLRVCPCELCVCDHENCQQVCIEFSGAMTRSCPPQITADCVRPVNCCC